MKTKIKLLTPMIVAAMVIFGSLDSYAQYGQDGQIFIPSPDVWSFMKYGNTPIDLYRGIAQTSIPVYTYKDKDFELPISIDYASSGFIPNVQTGILGLGWFLNAGGMITREVKGIPDEKRGDLGGSVSPYWGFLYYSSFDFGSNPRNPDKLMEKMRSTGQMAEYTSYTKQNSLNTYLETTSDIYHFKFGDHSGSFMLLDSLNGTYTTVFASNHPNGEYKIKVYEPSGTQTYDRKQKISIITGDGYEYVFGNHAYAYELDNTLDKWGGYTVGGQNNPDQRIEYPLSYMLTDIIAPNGRRIKLEYNPVPESIDEDAEYKSKKIHFCRPLVYKKKKDYPLQGTEWVSEVQVGIQYGTRLKRIDIDGKMSISFEYDANKTNEWYRLNNSTNKMTNENGRLTSIVVKAGNSTYQNCSFTYSTSINPPSGSSIPASNPVTFLNSITIDGRGTYTFDYYDKNKNFPFHGTSSIDHWGYYNYGVNGTTVISYDASRLKSVGLREPSLAGSQMGMLKQIIYPTGGKTTFDYELNSYKRKVIKFPDPNGGYPDLQTTSSNIPAGGVRIRKITDYSDNNTVSSERTFSYTNPDGTNSGILLHYPFYDNKFEYHNGIDWVIVVIPTDGNLLALSMDRYHIEYPVVREKFRDDSYIDHYFIASDKRPDVAEDNNAKFKDVPQSGPWYRDPISYHNERGKLSKKEYFDNSNSPASR